MTHMGELLKLIPNGNCYIQDIATEEKDIDKIFSISRKITSHPFEIDFILLRNKGFKALKFGQFADGIDELIVEYVGFENN